MELLSCDLRYTSIPAALPVTLVHLTGGTVGPVLDYTPAARVPRSHSPGLECTAPLFLELWGVSRMGNVLDGAQVARSVRADD